MQYVWVKNVCIYLVILRHFLGWMFYPILVSAPARVTAPSTASIDAFIDASVREDLYPLYQAHGLLRDIIIDSDIQNECDQVEMVLLVILPLSQLIAFSL